MADSVYDPGKSLSLSQEKELTNAVNNAARGRWAWILPSIVPEIASAISAGERKHVDCIFPDHQDGKRKFRITNTFADVGRVICTCTDDDPVSNGISLIMRARCCDFKTARTLVMEELGMRIVGSYSRPPPTRPLPPIKAGPSAEELKAERKKVQKRIGEIWGETIPLTHPDAEPAMLWFDNRSVLPQHGEFNDVRFHRSLAYYDGNMVIGHFPCIVSMLRDNTGMTRTLHRTFISQDGRKPAEIASGQTRKLFSVPNNTTAAGSAIRLDEPGVCLMLAEGLETALTARRLTGLPTWSCVSKDILKAIEIPECVKYVTIWADKDRSDAGQQAALDLYNRLKASGIRCVAMLPPGDITEGSKGLDWNDLLITHGYDAVRRDFMFRKWLQGMETLLSRETERTGLVSRFAST